jgi:signal transduction histidine kinase
VHAPHPAPPTHGRALVDVGRDEPDEVTEEHPLLDVALGSAAALATALAVSASDAPWEAWLAVPLLGVAAACRSRAPVTGFLLIALVMALLRDTSVAAAVVASTVLVMSVLTVAVEGRLVPTAVGATVYVGVLARAAALDALEPTVAVLYAAQGAVLVVAMLRLSADVTAGHAAERRAMQDAAETELRLRRANELERQRISLELHGIVTDAMRRVRASTDEVDDDDLVPALTAAEETSRQALQELRRMVKVLRSTEPHDLEASMRPQPDVTGVAELLATRAPDARTRIALGPTEDVDVTVSMAVYRLVEDALAFLSDPSGSTVSAATVERDGPRHLRVRVHGADVAATEMRLGYPHIVAMRERVDVVGGTVTIGTGAQGRGVVVDACFPVRRPAS